MVVHPPKALADPDQSCRCILHDLVRPLSVRTDFACRNRFSKGPSPTGLSKQIENHVDPWLQTSRLPTESLNWYLSSPFTNHSVHRLFRKDLNPHQWALSLFGCLACCLDFRKAKIRRGV